MVIFEMFGFGIEGWGGVLLFVVLMMVVLMFVVFVVGVVIGVVIVVVKLLCYCIFCLFGDLYMMVFCGVFELFVIYLFYFGGLMFVMVVGQWFGVEGFIGVLLFVIGVFVVGMILGVYQVEVYCVVVFVVLKGEFEVVCLIGMLCSMVLWCILVL